jgi:hypothetical protein
MLLCLFLSVATAASAQGGSMLAAWGNTSANAMDINQQLKWPAYLGYYKISGYDAVGEVSPSCVGSHSYSLWQTFVPSLTGRLTLYSSGSNYSSVVAIYQTSVSPENEISCINVGAAAYGGSFVTLTAGVRYYIFTAASGTGGTVDGTSELTLFFSRNSLAEGALTLPASGAYNKVQNRIEFADNGYIDLADGCDPANHVVYYKFRPTVTDTYEFSTNGSTYDTILAVTGVRFVHVCSENISTTNYNSLVQVNLTAGHLYYIAIGQSFNARPVQTTAMSLSLRVRRL